MEYILTNSAFIYMRTFWGFDACNDAAARIVGVCFEKTAWLQYLG